MPPEFAASVTYFISRCFSKCTIISVVLCTLDVRFVPWLWRIVDWVVACQRVGGGVEVKYPSILIVFG